ncbi:MAG TPA: NAD(P)/FAD-dependent oxidoreductase [Candidatus Eisenbacteria bacterium]|nr:NAD(P)/FAD-dependent oxidoreductase [Candidatus Eisenbacteria bacterium]
MARQTYDAIVVGARCAGSPTAMLLARKGYKVLLVDKATFPSDTISTHLIHPPGVAALRRWGLLDRVVGTGCPPIDTYMFDFGPFRIEGKPGTPESPISYGPRRTVLDKLLLDAAAEAGAEVREEFLVEDVVREDGRVTGIRGRGKGIQSVTDHARVVVGADGRHSLVAKATKPEQYQEKPQLLAAYYTYWSGLPMNGRFEAYIRDHCSFAVWPTNDGMTLVIAGWPYSKFEENKKDVEGSYHRVIDQAPAFAERLRGARREERFVGTAVPGYFRKPYGPGWVLVGDAGYNKDFITAMGMTDAFLQAEQCASALDDSFAGTRSFDAAMGEYQASRDRHAMPIYEFTSQLASQEPPPPHVQQLFAAVSRHRESMDAFARVNSGVLSPAEFFSPENIERIFAATEDERSATRA